MTDVTFQPLTGQTEISILGVAFAAGETKSFGIGDPSFTDDDAAWILTNPNFVDASLGRNPNYTCFCGKPITAFALDPKLGMVRTNNVDCGGHNGETQAQWEAAQAAAAATPASSSSTTAASASPASTPPASSAATAPATATTATGAPSAAASATPASGSSASPTS